VLGARGFSLVALAVALAASGCLGGKRLSDIGTHDPNVHLADGAALLPAGVIVPGFARMPFEVDGLYPSTIPNDRMCCWIATHARIRTVKAAPARRVDVTIFVPPYAFFERSPQGITLAIEGTRFSPRCCYGPGIHTLSFDLPANLRPRTGQVVLTLDTLHAFIPAREHVNTDSRSLGVVLSRVDYPADPGAQ
jgi:hypothetical protein